MPRTSPQGCLTACVHRLALSANNLGGQRLSYPTTSPQDCDTHHCHLSRNFAGAGSRTFSVILQCFLRLSFRRASGCAVSKAFSFVLDVPINVRPKLQRACKYSPGGGRHGCGELIRNAKSTASCRHAEIKGNTPRRYQIIRTTSESIPSRFALCPCTARPVRVNRKMEDFCRR